jgi:hypothetical protein
MTADDYASLSTTRLLELFADGARKMGVGRGNDAFHRRLRSNPLKVLVPSEPLDWVEIRSNIEKGLQTIIAVEKALRARGAIPEITRLLDEADPDVRFCAMMRFSDIAPELASSASHSFNAQLPTRDVLELRRRARQAPPSRPTLQEMSNDALIERFEDAATREGGSHLLDPIDEPEDQETCSRLNGELLDIMRELKVRGLIGKLTPLLDSTNSAVRFRAGQACLRSAEKKAVEALESVVANGDFEEAVAARETLDGWRKEECLVDGL